MRLCVGVGEFDEVAPDKYAHTKRSIGLLNPGYGYMFELTCVSLRIFHPPPEFTT